MSHIFSFISRRLIHTTTKKSHVNNTKGKNCVSSTIIWVLFVAFWQESFSQCKQFVIYLLQRKLATNYCGYLHMQRSVFFSKNSHIYKYNVIHPQKKHEKKLNYVILNANFQYNILKYVFWVFSSIWQMNRALKNKRNFLLKKKNNGLSTGMFGRVDFAGAKFNTQPETECFVCDVCFCARAVIQFRV